SATSRSILKTWPENGSASPRERTSNTACSIPGARAVKRDGSPHAGAATVPLTARSTGTTARRRDKENVRASTRTLAGASLRRCVHEPEGAAVPQRGQWAQSGSNAVVHAEQARAAAAVERAAGRAAVALSVPCPAT